MNKKKAALLLSDEILELTLMLEVAQAIAESLQEDIEDYNAVNQHTIAHAANLNIAIENYLDKAIKVIRKIEDR